MPRPPDHPGYQRLRSGRRSEVGRVYFLTTVTSGRQPLFASHAAAALMSRLMAGQDAWPGALLWAWVLMPDHWHGLLELQGDEPLASVVKRAKGTSARRFNLAQGRQGSVWRDGFHERAIRSHESLRATARYLVANPVRAGLVESVADYPFWDAFWLDGGSAPPIPD